MGISYSKLLEGAKLGKVLVGVGILFFFVGFMGAAWTDLPTGRFLLDTIVWWTGLYGFTWGGAKLVAGLRVSSVLTGFLVWPILLASLLSRMMPPAPEPDTLSAVSCQPLIVSTCTEPAPLAR